MIGKFAESYVLERIWDESLVVCFKVLIWDLPGLAEENHADSQSGSSRMQVRISTTGLNMFCSVREVLTGS